MNYDAEINLILPYRIGFPIIAEINKGEKVTQVCIST
jgi:hypothetical protein